MTDGILLVDKPGGCTSHDLVALARRAFGQREVGHAGTLDPMATGLLVLLLGEGTKLSAYLTADTKRYLATVRFGATTDTLDADGAVVARSKRPPPTREAIASALAAMVGPMVQVPPAVSAIKQGGVALHERLRRGEQVEPSPREVVLEQARVLAVREGECDLEILASKGFYVRALARDLAARLGDLGYLTVLRRTASGPFAVDEAVDGALLVRAAKHGDEASRRTLHAAVLPLAAAARALPTLEVDATAAVALGHGKALACPREDGTVLVTTPGRALPVCIARVHQGVLTVLRGFRAPA